MRCHYLFAMVLSIAASAYPNVAHADQVIMANGDRLTGTVLHKDSEALVLRTTYAGDVHLRCAEIVGIATEAPVDLLLDDGTTIRARLDGGDGGSAGTPKLARIRYIKPTVEESGVGYLRRGHAGLALSQTRGNSTNDLYHGDVELVLRAKTHRYTFGGEGNYGRDGGITSTSNWRTGARYDRFFAPKEFLYAKGALEKDRFKDIRLRAIVGGGYGYQVLEDETTTLDLRGGLSHVTVRHDKSDGEAYAALSWGLDFRHRLRLFDGELFHTQEGIRGFDGHRGIILQTRTGLRLPLGEQLNATAQVNADWESRPAPGRRHTDTTVMFGLGYSLR